VHVVHSSESTMCYRHLVIVAREDPTLFSYLVERFDGDTNVLVIMDRRSGRDRRATPAADRPTDRRSADRRGRPFLQDELRDRHHVVVSLTDDE